MKKRQVIALTMASVMSLGLLAGCGSKDAGKDSTANNGGNGEATATDEVVTLKWITVGNGMPTNYDAWLAQINPYLEEKIGVNLEMEIVPWGDWDQRQNVIVNANEDFDILFTNGVNYSKFISTGAFADLTDLVKEVTPDLYGFIPENYWTAVSQNGKIYGVPTYKDSSYNEYFVWDKDVTDKYGVDIESVQTMEDVYNALKPVKEGEGVAPYHMCKDGANFLTAWYDDMGAGSSLIGVKYDDETATVVNPWADEEVLAQLDWVHKMYKEGIINGDAPQIDNQPGKYVLFTAQGWSGAAKTSWGPQNGITNCVATKMGETFVSNSTVRGSINAISANCEHPDKALELLQLVNTDTKVRDLLYFGVEGENFEYTDDKKVHKLNEDWTMAGYTQGTFFNVSMTDKEETSQWDEVKALNESAKPSVLLGFNMDTSKVQTELANLSSIYEKYRAEFFTGAQNPRELIETIKSECEAAGWEKVRAEAQAQIDAFLGK